MKKIILLATALLVLPAVLLATGCDSIVPPRTTVTAGEGGNQQTGIWVSGRGEVSVAPDLAVLQLGVQAQDSTVAAAQAAAGTAMNRVLTALKEAGVQPEDIQTQYFNISQRTRWDDATQQQVVTGYQVSNTVTAKIRVLDVESYTLDYKTGRVIDAAVSAGGDFIRINDLSFTVEDPTRYYDEARQLATADALEKAKQLAKQNDVRLGPPTYINESAAATPVYAGATVGAAPVPAPAAPPVSAGQVKVTLNVQVAYAME